MKKVKEDRKWKKKMILEKQGQETVYSDGQIEDRVIQYLIDHKDNHAEIIRDLPEGAVFHNFTAARENLISWYPFTQNDAVLEIGAGMGALTEQLARMCKSVVALEPSEKRAKIIEKRCSSYPNVKVVAKGIDEYQNNSKFDYVLLIGVLEYAGITLQGENPWLQMINLAKQFLKENGRLLIAIENQFGLKYWCGAAEDHTGIPFDSINGYQESSGETSRYQKMAGVRTFSQEDLNELLQLADLYPQKYYYPFPDYKFPMLILSDDSKDGNLIQDVKFNYPEESSLIANQEQIYPEVIKNGCLGFFANSFLIQVGLKLEESQTHAIETVAFKRDYLPAYQIITTIEHETVVKKAANRDAEKHLQELVQNTNLLRERGIPCVVQTEVSNGITRAERIHAPRADRVFEQAIIEEDSQLVFEMLEKLREYILKSSRLIERAGQVVLENAFSDMTFRNSFWTENDLLFFDQEWAEAEQPLDFILYRSIKYASKVKNTLYQAALQYCGLSEEKIKQFEEAEQKFLNGLMDSTSCSWFDKTMYQDRLLYKNKVQVQLQNKDAHIEQLLESERRLNRETAAQTEQIASLTEKTTYQDGKIAALKELSASQTEEIARLTAETAVQTEHLNVLTKEAEEKETQILKLEKTAASQSQQIAELTSENTSKNHQISELLAQTSDLTAQTDAQTNQIADLTAQTDAQTNQIADLTAQTDAQTNQIEELKQTLNNKLGHIELLLESDRELERIKASRTWRLMGYVWKVRDVLIPVGSRRRLFAKLFYKFLKNPVHFLSKCTPGRIFRFFKTLSRRGTLETSRLLDVSLQGTAIPKQVLEIEQVAQKAVTEYEPLHIPTWETVQVSIVIPVYNQFDYTYACIRSILQNSGNMTYEIIIADDCSSDGTKEIDRVITGLKTIHNRENLRFLRNCNHAAQFARGEYLLFLNNDTQVQENWLAPLVELMERDASIGMTGSKLVYPDGSLQEAGGIFWNDASAWNYGNRADATAPEYNYVKDVDYISGASICIRKTLWKEIGGFDDQFAPAYCEDSDLAFEVRKHGYRVVYQPLSVVVHFEGVSNGTDTSSGQKAYQVVNQEKLREKWRQVLETEHFPNGEHVFQARDRSRYKKTVLVVDHYVPQYDKDAGSRTVFAYLKLFAENGYSVKFIGDNFFPHQPYTQTLQQMGIEVLYGPYYANHWMDWLKENGDCIQYVLLNRPHISVKYIDAVRKLTPARIMYYGHDLHFLRERREYELTGDPETLRSSEKWKQNELSLMRKADMAYYPSCVEEEAIHEIDPSIHVKAIPAYLFSDVKEVPYSSAQRKDLMFIGGFGHHPNVDAVQWLASEIMPHLETLLPGVKIHILGSNPPEEVTKLASETLCVEGFVTDEQLERYYQTSRLVIVPLRYGAGIKGKVVEAMRYGMPVVTTSIGAEGITGAENILTIEDEPQEFAQAVASLYGNEALLKQRSAASYQYVREHYSPENAKRAIGPEFDMT